MRVKICGITTLDEARMAIGCGADALGFLLGLNYPTDDEVSPSNAAEIIAALPPFVSSALVTHKKELGWVAEMCQRIGCTTIQLHGEFPLEEIPALRTRIPYARIIKAVHVVDSDSVALAERVAYWADAVLLDTKTETRIGGTGITHDWSISAKIVKKTKKPIILSGGLNPINVSDAIVTVAPFAVDVNSGVENSNGTKSLEKVREFIRLAKQSGEHSYLTPLSSAPR